MSLDGCFSPLSWNQECPAFDATPQPSSTPGLNIWNRIPFELIFNIVRDLSAHTFLQLSLLSPSILALRDANQIWRFLVGRDYPTWMSNSYFTKCRLLRRDHDWKGEYIHFFHIDQKICQMVTDVSRGSCLRSVAAERLLQVNSDVAADSLMRMIHNTNIYHRYGLAVGNNARALLLSIRRRQAVKIWQSEDSRLETLLAAFDLFWLPCTDNSLTIDRIHNRLDDLAHEFNRTTPSDLSIFDRALHLTSFIHNAGYGDKALDPPLLANNFMSSLFREKSPGSSPPLTAVLFSALAQRCGLPEAYAFPLLGRWVVAVLSLPIEQFEASDLEKAVLFLNPHSPDPVVELSIVALGFGITGTSGSAPLPGIYLQLRNLIKAPTRLRKLFIATFCSYTRRLAKRAYATDQTGGDPYAENYSNLDQYNSLTSARPEEVIHPEVEDTTVERGTSYPFDIIHYADANYACLWASAMVERAHQVGQWMRPLFGTIRYWYTEDAPFADSLFGHNEMWNVASLNPDPSNPSHVFPTPLESLVARWNVLPTNPRPRNLSRAPDSPIIGGPEYGNLSRRHGYWEPEHLSYRLGSLVVHKRDGHVYVVFMFQWPNHVYISRGFVHRVVEVDEVRPYDGGPTAWPDGRVMYSRGFNLDRLLIRGNVGSGTVNDFLRFAGTVFRTVRPDQGRLTDWAAPAETGVTVDNL